MKVKSESEVAQLCPTLSDSMDCSLRGSSVHGTLQARVLEWGAIAFFRRKEICDKPDGTNSHTSDRAPVAGPWKRAVANEVGKASWPQSWTG